MDHGVVDVFAYQEALLIEAAFAIALLAMIWVAFRRWIQHKENLGRWLARETAEQAARHDAEMEQVEARLKAIEQTLGDGRDGAAASIGRSRVNLPSGEIVDRDEV